MVTGQDRHAEDGFYRGVPLPDSLVQAYATNFPEDSYPAGWRDGVDAVLTRYGDMQPTEDTAQDTSAVVQDRTALSPADEVNAFALVTEDRTDEARDIVSRMSGRDRAVLSFWLRELEDIVLHLETRRTMSR